MSSRPVHPRDPRLTAPTGVTYTPTSTTKSNAPSQMSRPNGTGARFVSSETTGKHNSSASAHFTSSGTNSTCSAAATLSFNDLSVQHNNAMVIDAPSPNAAPCGNSFQTTTNGVQNTAASNGADRNGNRTPPENYSITVMFGPPERPDKNHMSPEETAKLPKKVQERMMRSNSNQKAPLGGRAYLLRFTTPHWYKSLSKVKEYSITGDYTPRTPLSLLEIVDKNGRLYKWSPELQKVDCIVETASTEETHQMFLAELDVYKLARYIHYDELKEHAFHRLYTEYPVFARECLAVVEVLCSMMPDHQIEECMRDFITEAIKRNKKQIGALTGFPQALDRAIGSNLLATLLQSVQKETIQALHAELFMAHRSINGSQVSQRVNNGPAVAELKREGPTKPERPTDAERSSSPMNLESEPSAEQSEHTILLQKLQEVTKRGRLVKARVHGFGTLLPPKQHHHGFVPRNKSFRVEAGDLLVIDHTSRPSNGLLNVVVENMHGERGDMIKSLFDVMTFTPLEQPAGLPAKPRGMQSPNNTHRHSISETPSGQTVVKEEGRPLRRRERSRSPSRSRSRSPDHKGRRSSKCARSPPPHIDRYTSVFGRR